jgi:hypothetical protein
MGISPSPQSPPLEGGEGKIKNAKCKIIEAFRFNIVISHSALDSGACALQGIRRNDGLFIYLIADAIALNFELSGGVCRFLERTSRTPWDPADES